MKSAIAMPKGKGGKQYHIALKRGDLAPYCLLPGDPGRVEKIAASWDTKKQVAYHREFHSMTGNYNGAPVSCLSTGIGSPAEAIAVEEAARIGVDTFIRVGSTGALQSDIDLGDLVISTASVRLDGTSQSYVRPEYPASAHYEVVLALIEACEKLKFRYHVGVTASADAFYVGEGRPGLGGYEQSYHKHIVPDLIKAGVANIEMETSALFTLASLYKLRAGAICTVFDNLVTNKWKVTGEEKVGKAASEAVAILHEWDKLKKKKRKKYFFPSLLN
ncbi:nucleoside phosphorylase [Patescibacteria group bacterium AH-259-L07]|nr:nucleoside phosphorylase [Patescibacteria group bacterium AH-259-L07]